MPEPMSGTATIAFEPFTEAHLDAAVGLSRGEKWPHRRDDWALGLSLSRGVAAMAGGRLIGTALATPFGTVTMLNMIIVAPEMRGQGLGRALMERAMRPGSEEWRLVATRDGVPLYRKFGFAETGEIVQHQGPVASVAPPDGVTWALAGDVDAIMALDRAATGMDRSKLIAALARLGRLAVLRDGDGLAGYGAIRLFGRGEVAGPVIARDAEDAQRLLRFLLAGRTGGFIRVDTQIDSGLAPWLAGLGLLHVGGGIRMSLGHTPPAASSFGSFALAAQALG